LLLLPQPAATAQGPARNQNPDIFLITIDTLRADHLHCYGYRSIATPAIDTLATDGVRFERAFTPSPITNTSHTSILTGLLPSSHGVMDFGIPLSPSYPTAAELLKARGYKTAAFIGAVILDSKTLAPGLDRGFDFYDNFPAKPATQARFGRLERRAGDVIHHAEQWMTAHPGSPRFVWLHLYDPHDPYEPPPPFSQTYKERPYDGEIAYADSALGAFFAFLKKHNWYRPAVIVLVGDHGEGLGEHGEDTHGIFLYDTTTHVPLLVKLPVEKPAAKVVSAQVRTTDILPTLLDWSGDKSQPHFDGSSLRPYIMGSETAGRTAIGETDYPLRFGWAPLRSVRADEKKFIEAPRPEFYDLTADAKETDNLYKPWDGEVQKARAVLAEVRKRQSETKPTAATVGEGTLSELRALGYLGSADAGSSTSVPEPSLLPDPKDHIREQNLLHAAMLATEDNRAGASQHALEQVLVLNPASFEALRQLGQLELESGEFGKAAEHLGTAQRQRPDDAALNLLLGEALAKTGDAAGATAALERSLKASPGQLSGRLLLGKLYLEAKNYGAARDQFEAALLLDANNAEAKRGLAEAEAHHD
jgi:arylsulfatase A-like enzyme/Tfp pilus assembly protein PilF